MSTPVRAKKLLLAEDDPAQLRLLRALVSETNYEVLTATNGHEALEIVLREGPHLVVADWRMPQMDGLELCRALRRHEGVRFVYIIVVSGQSDIDGLVECFNAGADDFIPKPLRKEELLARLRAAERIVALESALAHRTREVHAANAQMAVAYEKLEQANAQLKSMAITDELTGLTNRREALNQLNRLWSEALRYERCFSAVLVDIDHFKQFNDRYGHDAGDTILKQTADLLQASVRATDLVCRLGGEEFLIVCQEARAEEAAVCAERARGAIEFQRVMYGPNQLRVTISAGVASIESWMKSPDDLLKAADQAMYASKRGGRNCVTVAALQGASTSA